MKDYSHSRETHEKTRESSIQVTALAANGVNISVIASYLGIAVPTLHKWYRKELQEGKASTSNKVGSFLKSAATGDALLDGATHADCLRAAMFWAKTQMGFKEVQGIDHTSTDGTMSPQSVDPKLVAELAKKLVE